MTLVRYTIIKHRVMKVTVKDLIKELEKQNPNTELMILPGSNTCSLGFFRKKHFVLIENIDTIKLLVT
jgi:hypothetical protein